MSLIIQPTENFCSETTNLNIEKPTMTRVIGGREILNLRFNQEQNLFACSTDAGLTIYNVEPLAVKTCLGELKLWSCQTLLTVTI